MTGEYNGKSAEEELTAIRGIEDWRIPEAMSLQLSLGSLDTALKALVESDAAWQGEAGDAARAHVTQMRTEFARIEKLVGVIVGAIDTANTSRRATVSGTELPSDAVPPFWVNAVKAGGTVTYPGLGPLPANTALSAISNLLAGQRDEQAQKTVESVRTAMVDPTQKIAKARAEMAGDEQTPPGGAPASGGPMAFPGGSYPGGTGGSYPGSVSGGYPGGAGSVPGGGGGGGLIGGPAYPPGGTYPGGPGPFPGDRPTIDDPNLNGHVPGGGVPGHGTLPGGSAGGTVPGGLLGGAIGGGGAAALAFGARGGLSGLGGRGLSGLTSGGLLGGGTGGVSGAGGAGAAQPGATGMGSRSGGGMVGGQGGSGSEEKKQRRGGADGPIAEHLEDDDEPIARAKGARAGSRDDASE
ncbi:hypothetical protein [Microbacterium panaciterrae]|uniref:PPE family protein n=1 Tax=Microbacterium panaciterrae TaxID=985759 RepID=A0ABP8P2P9_9MICO